MKTLQLHLLTLSLLSACCLLLTDLFSQGGTNIGINTTSPAGKLHIKGSANSSQLIIDANNTQSNTNPLLKLRSSSGADLLWMHSDEASSIFIGVGAGSAVGAGTNNTFVGAQAGASNTTGNQNSAFGFGALNANTGGDNNTASGVGALNYNSTGDNNTANGNVALYSNTTGSGNTANGFATLNANTIGDYNTASGYAALNYNSSGTHNTALGSSALYSNTTGTSSTAVGFNALWTNNGSNNTAIGADVLSSNTTGHHNTATGNAAMYSNTEGSLNTVAGAGTLYSNTTGSDNIAVGVDALHFNTTGQGNTATGTTALLANTTGNGNTANGFEAMVNNTEGEFNAAYGKAALGENSTGNYNTAIGAAAGSYITGSNNNCFGWFANVPISIGNDQVRVGNTYITYAGIEVAWTVTSDSRRKSDIRESNLGLDFISKLKPVSYYRTNDESKKREYGFIAQELEEALNTSGAADNGIIAKDDHGMYGVRYNDLMTPMVKAIQELNEQNASQQVLIAQQDLTIADLLLRIEALEKMIK